MNWIELAQNRLQALVYTVINLNVQRMAANMLTISATVSLSKRTLFNEVRYVVTFSQLACLFGIRVIKYSVQLLKGQN